jgi:hypothetical protein
VKLSKLTKNDLSLIEKLLGQHVDMLCNKGFNDFDLPMTQENVDLLNEFEQWNYRNSDDKSDMVEYKFDSTKRSIQTMDFISDIIEYKVASILKSKLKQEINNEV